MRRWALAMACVLVSAGPARGQEIRGRVLTIQGSPVAGASVILSGTPHGVAADSTGRFTLEAPAGAYRLQVSAVGFLTWTRDLVLEPRFPLRVDVVLREHIGEVGEALVEGAVEAQVGAHRLAGREVTRTPSPTRDALQSLKSLPGVVSRNELSNQVSVRGGGFNENQFLIAGFEITLPLRPRTAEQEGLSVVNPDLVRSMELFTGGFPARFGGRLASVTQAEYGLPPDVDSRLAATVTTTMLAAAYGRRFSSGQVQLAVRDADPARIFGSQDLKGTYSPGFRDAQVYAEARRGAWSIEAVGVSARQSYELDPESRRTFFVDPTRFVALWESSFSPSSFLVQNYRTELAGLRLGREVSRAVVRHDVSLFRTREAEGLLMDVLMGVCSASVGTPPDEASCRDAAFWSRDEAESRASLRRWAASGSYLFPFGLDLGWGWSSERSVDAIRESGLLLDVQSSPPDTLGTDVLDSTWTLDTRRAYGFAEYVHQRGSLSIATGLRTEHYSFTGETTVSPRVSARWRPGPLTTYRASWGIYYQGPTYRELRSDSAVREPNVDLRSQRSHQVTLGAERLVPAKQLTLRAEAYYKRLSNLISYEADNVRINYSGVNDSEGYARGFDLQVRGHWVPGLESWANYSYLVSRERFQPAFVDESNTGWRPRPMDQRHTFSMFVQDFIPGHPAWRMHLMFFTGSGLPYTQPVTSAITGSLLRGEPGPRNAKRYPKFFRVDAGMSRIFELGPARLETTLEVLNLFNNANVVAYSFLPRRSGGFSRVPTRLTPFLLNAGVRLEW